LLKHRILSGSLLGVVVMMSAFFMPAPGLLILLLLISALAQLEFYSMIRAIGIPCYPIIGVLGGSAMILVTFLTGERGVASPDRWENFVLVGTLLVVFIRQFPQRENSKPIETIACTLMGVWYVSYLFNFFTHLLFIGAVGDDTLTGRLLVMYLIVVVKFSDIGAYLVGMTMGRHKLMPRISPKKTWEGLFGGFAFAIASSCLFVWLTRGKGMIHVGWMHAVIMGLLLAMVGIVGDMFESLLKRAANLKDSSSSIPGMGGLLDVLDSLLFGVPVLYVYVKVFLS